MLYAIFALFALTCLLIDMPYWFPINKNTPAWEEDWWDHPS